MALYWNCKNDRRQAVVLLDLYNNFLHLIYLYMYTPSLWIIIDWYDVHFIFIYINGHKSVFNSKSFYVNLIFLLFIYELNCIMFIKIKWKNIDPILLIFK